jgi:regulator of cell morphogenesis and NO signaling
MSSPSLQSRVGDLVVERPSRSRVFGALGIDFCCGGEKTLAEACRERNLDGDAVLARLDEAPAPDSQPSWADARLGALCDHLERKHHALTRAEIPRLQGLVDKVARVHGGRHPEMVEVEKIFSAFGEEMLEHMAKEERVLFPAIRGLEAGVKRDVSMPIRVMMREHEGAGAAMARMRELTGGFAPPTDGCNTFRAALAGLAELEADLHEHVHLENNLLFPRALAR